MSVFLLKLKIPPSPLLPLLVYVKLLFCSYCKSSQFLKKFYHSRSYTVLSLNTFQITTQIAVSKNWRDKNSLL